MQLYSRKWTPSLSPAHLYVYKSRVIERLMEEEERMQREVRGLGRRGMAGNSRSIPDGSTSVAHSRARVWRCRELGRGRDEVAIPCHDAYTTALASSEQLCYSHTMRCCRMTGGKSHPLLLYVASGVTATFATRDPDLASVSVPSASCAYCAASRATDWVHRRLLGAPIRWPRVMVRHR